MQNQYVYVRRPNKQLIDKLMNDFQKKGIIPVRISPLSIKVTKSDMKLYNSL